jgi:hypothetical protein
MSNPILVTQTKDKPKCQPRQVVLLRHGESLWNKENRFSGWTDVAQDG